MVLALEVLGLALGIAPLMTEFLKSNPAPIHTKGELRRGSAHDTMDDFYINLGYEMALLRITLHKLVEDLPIDEDTKAKLMGDTTLDSSIWKRPSHELRQCLERRLSPCLDTFEQCMEKILCLLAKLVKDSTLPIPISEGQIRVFAGRYYEKLEVVYDSGISLSQRLKFGWRKDKREKLLTKISKYNRKLQQMLEQTHPTTQGHGANQQTTRSSHVSYLGLRERLTTLAQVMERLGYGYFDRYETRVGLSWANVTDDHISLMILIDLAEDPYKSAWSASRVRVSLAKHGEQLEESGTKSVLQPVSDRRAQNLSQVSVPTRSPEAAENRAHYLSTLAEADFHNPSTIPTSRAPLADAPSMSKSLSNVTKVDNIIDVFKQEHRRRSTAELAFHQGEILQFPSNQGSPLIGKGPGLRLGDIVRHRRWTMQDRKTLQVLLARSVLWFPWEGAQLNKDAITFHDGTFQEPFVAFRPMTSPNRPDPCYDDDTAYDSYRPYPNEVLAALATVLLEIEIEKPIEDMMIDEDLADDMSETRFWATTRLLQEQRFNIYSGCFDSIEACLRCDFIEGQLDLNDEPFLELVYQRIVAPLEEELWRGFNVRISPPEPGVETEPYLRPVEADPPPLPQAEQKDHLDMPRKAVRILAGGEENGSAQEEQATERTGNDSMPLVPESNLAIDANLQRSSDPGRDVTLQVRHMYLQDPAYDERLVWVLETMHKNAYGSWIDEERYRDFAGKFLQKAAHPASATTISDCSTSTSKESHDTKCGTGVMLAHVTSSISSFEEEEERSLDGDTVSMHTDGQTGSSNHLSCKSDGTGPIVLRGAYIGADEQRPTDVDLRQDRFIPNSAIVVNESTRSVSMTDTESLEDSLTTIDPKQEYINAREREKQDLADRLTQYAVSLGCAAIGIRNCASMGTATNETSSASGDVWSTSGELASPKLSMQHDCHRDDRHRSEGDDSEGEDRHRKRKRPLPAAREVRKSVRPLACPYFKRDPRRYSTCRACTGPGWPAIGRLKEHLYRLHVRPNQCARCGAKFGSLPELQAHTSADNRCNKCDFNLDEGLDQAQERQLRSRKKSNKSEEEKWLEMYVILFPEDHESAIPTPHYEYVTHEGLGSDRPPEDAFAFLTKEMPGRVRSEILKTLESELNPVESKIKAQLPSILQIVLDALRAEFSYYHRQTQSFPDTAEPVHVASTTAPNLTSTSDLGLVARSTAPTAAIQAKQSNTFPTPLDNLWDSVQPAIDMAVDSSHTLWLNDSTTLDSADSYIFWGDLGTYNNGTPNHADSGVGASEEPTEGFPTADRAEQGPSATTDATTRSNVVQSDAGSQTGFSTSD